MGRRHYITDKIGNRTDEVLIYKEYRDALESGDPKAFTLAVAPMAVHAASKLVGLDGVAFDDVVSGMLLILCTLTLSIVTNKKEFGSPRMLTAYVNKRLYPSLIEVYKETFSEVVNLTSLEDLLVSSPVSADADLRLSDRDVWVRRHAVEQIRFDGWKRDCCLLLLDHGPGALDKVVKPRLVEFFSAYVSFLVRVAIDEYASL